MKYKIKVHMRSGPVVENAEVELSQEQVENSALLQCQWLNITDLVGRAIIAVADISFVELWPAKEPQ